MLRFVIAAAGLIPLVFYIIACATTSWSTYNTSVVKIGLFRSSNPSTGDSTGCGGTTGSDCDKIQVAEAFTVVALVALAPGIGFAVKEKGLFTAAAFAISGVCGMIGWAVWYGGFVKNGGLSSGNYDIGYSQALDIAAWVITLVLAAAAGASLKEHSSSGFWLRYVIGSCAVAPLAFYVVACATTNWSIMDVSTNAVKSGLFRSTSNLGDTTGCGSGQTSLDGSDCDKLRAAEAFTVVALILLAPAIGLAAMEKGLFSAAAFGASGIFGMIGWAIYYGGLVKNGSSTITSISFDIGYSQALDIAAWSLALVLAGATAVLLKQRPASTPHTNLIQSEA